MRLAVAAAVSCIFISTLSAAEHAAAAITQPTDIPAESLGNALEALARDRKLQLIYATDDVGSRQSQGAVGNLSTGEALKQLLHGTGLSYQFLDDRTVTVQPVAGKFRGSETEKGVGDPGPMNDPLMQELRLAQSSQGAAPISSNVTYGHGASVDSDSASRLEEILVTAQKTGVAERLQDIPIPISVISAQALVQTNQAQIQDYFNQIPGLSISQTGDGLSIVSIRGLTTGQNTNPTVGYTLDDVPMGGSTAGTAYSQIPSINPADLGQVEVLRGPQGTLYGDNSMGGLIRYVTIDPSTDHIFGDVRVGGDSVANGRHLGYSANAVINLPITDTLAIRASAFTRMDPGYIDNVETGERGVNTTKASGGRVAVKWAPSEDFSLKFSFLSERSQREGSDIIDLPTSGYSYTSGLGDRQQYDMPRTGFYDQVFKTTNLTLSGNLLGVKVMSITGYTYNEYSTSYDLSWALDPPPSATGTGTPLYVSNQSHKFSQEVRLSGTMGSHLEWLLGGFYTQENTRSIETITTTKVATGAVFDLASGTIGGNIPGDYLYQYAPDRFREEAGFGALTLKMTDSFDIQVGARESYMETPSLFGWGGGLFNGDPPGASVYSPPSSEYWKGNAFTYMVSPRYRLTSDLMVYARVADGFRPGSGTNNPQPTDSCVQQHTPCIVHPDKTTDYEIGTKADFFNRTLSVDASIYYIKWTDLQVNLVGANDLNYNGNGAGAKSQGVDLSLSWKPLEGLTVSTWGAWNQAVVTQAFANASAGQPLPFSSRFSGNFSVEQGIHITSSLDAFVSATEIYVGNRPGPFTAIAAPREDMPAYSQTNLNVGIKAKPWTFGLYANNVTDRRAILFGGPGTGDAPYEFNYIKPRMIGLSVEMAF